MASKMIKLCFKDPVSQRLIRMNMKASELDAAIELGRQAISKATGKEP